MYLVVFRNRKRPGIDAAAYAAAAEAMETLARAQPGYLGFKSFIADDGEVLALSEWTDESAARAWGMQAEHRLVQQRGRSEWYAEYVLQAGAVTREHRYPPPRS